MQTQHFAVLYNSQYLNKINYGLLAKFITWYFRRRLRVLDFMNNYNAIKNKACCFYYADRLYCISERFIKLVFYNF